MTALDQVIQGASQHRKANRSSEGVVERASSVLSQPPKTERLLRACAWCERIDVGGRWLDPSTAIRRLRTYEWPQAPRFTHGVCEPCLAALLLRRELPLRVQAEEA